MLIVFGIAILIGLLFQIVTGYALMPYGSGKLIDREKQRSRYWESIVLQTLMAFGVIGVTIYFHYQ